MLEQERTQKLSSHMYRGGWQGLELGLVVQPADWFPKNVASPLLPNGARHSSVQADTPCHADRSIAVSGIHLQ